MSSASFAPVPEPVLVAIAGNDATAFSALAQSLDVNSFYVWTDPKTSVTHFRSLCMIAAFHSATDVLGTLLTLGADPTLHSPDDHTTALHCACSNPCSSSTTLVLKQLMGAGARLDVLDKHNRAPRDLLALETAQAPPSEDEMQKDCFKTDDFRMYSFKVELCQRLEEQHDWTTCPFMHPGEKARRRDPRCFKYEGVPCPDFRKGSCKRGDACGYAHGVFECWLHPARYRTQLCKEGALCKRSVCFFAHSMDELREPLFLHGEKQAEQPGSPTGPLTPCEGSTQDCYSRSSSPGPLTARGESGSAAAASSCISAFAAGLAPAGSAAAALRTPPLAACEPPRPISRRNSFCSGGKALRSSTESVRSVLSREHSMGPSVDSSLSSTPVLDHDGGLAASLCGSSDLARSLSSLSLGTLPQDDMMAAAAAAAAAAVAALSVASPNQPQTLPPGAGAWGLGPGLQVSPNDVLSYQLAAAGLQLPLAPVLPDTSAVLQAAALQQQLALAQQQGGVDPAAALLAAARLRQPLQTLSLNLNHAPYQASPTHFPACFGLQ